MAGLSSRWNRLPPTLLTALLVIGICIPQAILGLPVAAAVIGPLPALAVFLLAGALMTLSLTAEAESIARSARFREGKAFLGRLSDQYLGIEASRISTSLAAARTGLSVLAAYIGLAVTMASLTGVPRPVWATITIGLLAVLLLRGGLTLSVDLGAAVGLIGTALILILAGLALAHADLDGLTRTDVPLLGGEATPAAALGTLAGTSLAFFIGNVYVVQVARRMLPRDPDGSTTVRGTLAGTAALTVIGTVWLVPVTAAVPPARLAAETGTALVPLAEVAGPAATVIGTVATVLLLGLGLERTSIALHRFVGERIGPNRLLCSAPALAICLAGEALVAAGAITFSQVNSLMGIMANVVVAGVVPLLLVVAARRLGALEPGATAGRFGRPTVVKALLGVYTLLLLAFATVIANSTAERVGAVIGLLLLLEILRRYRRFRAEPNRPAATNR